MKLDALACHSDYLIKKVMECATNAIYAIDLQGKFMFINEAGARICGRPVQELVGKPFSMLFDKEPLQGVAIAFHKTAFYGEVITNFQTRLTQPSGETRDITFSIAPLIVNDKCIGVVGTAEDITESRKIQESLRQREAKLSSIINTTTEGYWEIDNLNRTVEVNDALCRMLGYSREELVGASMYDFVDEANARVFKEQESLRALKTHRSFNITLTSKEGKEVHTRVQATTLRDKEGNVTGAFAFLTDITELLQIEGSIAKYAAELERSNRELQDFAYIASHDLQEPLRKIVAFGDRLYDKSIGLLDEQGKDYLKRMQSAALRMQTFIEDLLQYSRVMTKPQPFEIVDLKVIVQQAIIDLQECFVAENSSVLMDDLPEIELDPLQMRQLFANLLSNAIKFQKPHESPYIKIACGYTDSGHVEIRVQDNGIGFDNKYKNQLFKPFSRLHGKAEYPGTGIGLAICERIVKRHGGSIDVDSEPGKGTTFIITLPIRQAKGGITT